MSANIQSWPSPEIFLGEVMGAFNPFISGAVPLSPAFRVFSIAHTLGYAPNFVFGWIVCTANDAATGFVAGQRVNLMTLFNSASGMLSCQIWADTLNINGYIADFDLSGQSLLNVVTGDLTSPTAWTNFSLIVAAI